jgi:AhpD family alkylhydroperoxidase
VIFALAVDASKSCNACIEMHSKNIGGVAARR